MEDRWKIDGNGIIWEAGRDKHLPHSDRLEMSGTKVSMLVYYGAEEDGTLKLRQEVVFPLLRKSPNDTHASLIVNFNKDVMTDFSVDGKRTSQERLMKVRFDGILTLESRIPGGIRLCRSFFPAQSSPCVFQELVFTNETDMRRCIKLGELTERDYIKGAKGIYETGAFYMDEQAGLLEPQGCFRIMICYEGKSIREASCRSDGAEEKVKRKKFCESNAEMLKLVTPDACVNQAFAFAKLRVSESIFDTAAGKMHSPGGRSYYAAIWTNDEVEYANPFFAMLGNASGLDSAINSYRHFMNFMGPLYENIPTSIIAEGNDIWEGAGDRGDAAMYLYGASRFVLLCGDPVTAEELWEGIRWCATYCRRKTGQDGVVCSDSDELENRFESGSANLSTSCLAYGGYRLAAKVAAALGKVEYERCWRRYAEELEEGIETYFGGTVQGYHTYRYYAGNDKLRSWICMPLTVGIRKRKEETLRALFSDILWTADGIRTEAGDKTFWDRSTLYAFKGASFVGETDKVFAYLKEYVRRRLLGEHVPYPVEAYPEGDQQQLSGESALLCRVFLDGILGIEPVSFHEIRCRPSLPAGWNEVSLENIYHSKGRYSLYFKKKGAQTCITIKRDFSDDITEYKTNGNEGVVIQI